ncbi:MAG TPA: hypothetical protein VFB58_01135 [Chloroflexota bacterium]|nr:hypothetical protein [Chloroflexota bacterium]
MTESLPRLVMLEEITEPSLPLRPDDPNPPVRTLRDRRGNRYVLLSVAGYLRLLSRKEDDHGVA